MKRDYFELIERAYRIDQDDPEWYRSIAEGAAQLTDGDYGAMAYSFDASSPESGVTINAWSAVSVPESFVDATIDLNRSTLPRDAERFYHRGVLCGTVSEMLRGDGETIDNNRTYAESVGGRGFSDTFGLTASSPTHRGVVINSPLPQQSGINPRVRRAWRQIGVHLQAAYRLRAAQTSLHRPEAVIDGGGTVLHCEAKAKTPGLRDRLRSAAIGIDAARSRKGPTEPDEALELWRGLVSGRWTLIETFEGDGRRFFLAYPNEFDLPNPRALAPRERAVVAHAVQGDSNKWIAYQLGISAPTVARHLSSALRKIGLEHRHQLIWFYQSLHRDDHSIKP